MIFPPMTMYFLFFPSCSFIWHTERNHRSSKEFTTKKPSSHQHTKILFAQKNILFFFPNILSSLSHMYFSSMMLTVIPNIGYGSCIFFLVGEHFTFQRERILHTTTAVVVCPQLFLIIPLGDFLFQVQICLSIPVQVFMVSF